MWSVGCIAAELLLGIPLFPGANEYNQMYKISEMLGEFPPAKMIEKGVRAPRLFKRGDIVNGQQTFVFKTISEYRQDTGNNIDIDRKYFVYNTLSELIERVHFKVSRSKVPIPEIRKSFEHFLRGLLSLDPSTRWTARIALEHPFLKEGAEALDPLHSFPPPDLLAQISKETHFKQQRALYPPAPFQKTISRATLFPPSVIRSNGTVDFEASYSLFTNALKENKLIDIATGNPISPVLEEKLRQERQQKETEMEEESQKYNIEGGMAIESSGDLNSANPSIAASFSQTHSLFTPVGVFINSYFCFIIVMLSLSLFIIDFLCRASVQFRLLEV